MPDQHRHTCTPYSTASKPHLVRHTSGERLLPLTEQVSGTFFDRRRLPPRQSPSAQ